MAVKTFKKKTNENAKEELLKYLREKDENEDEETETNTVNNLTKVIEVMYHYEQITKTLHKRVIQYIYKQEEILQMFKETANLSGNHVTFEISQSVKNIAFCFLNKWPTKMIGSITIVFYFYPYL